MKNIFLIAVVAALVFSNSVIHAQILPTGLPFPTDKNERKRDRDDRIERDRDGRVINNERNLPPGQAKKVYGEKSAKVYAPGQRKKRGNGSYSNLPPQRISVDDRNAQRDRKGQYYYTDANGYKYWKGYNGFYYLDRKYKERVKDNHDRYDDGDDHDHDYNKKDKKDKHNKGKNKSKGNSRD
jgi:hypothetical protein